MQLFAAGRRTLIKFSILFVVALALVAEGCFVYTAQFVHADATTPTSLIKYGEVHQTIDGFGVASAWSADSLQQFPEPQRSRVLDLLFSRTEGAGFSIVRNEIGSGGGTPATTSTQTIEPTEGNFTWNVDAGQIWEMQQARQRGISTFISSVWSAPAWMKTNNSVTNGGHIHPDKYQAYANYLAQYVLGYRQHFGLRISAISPANEPNLVAGYQTNEWTADEFKTFIRDYLKPTFTRNHVPAKVFMPEEVTWTDDLASATLQDPAASAGIDIIAAHDYTPGNPIPFADAKAQGKGQWMSETSGGSTDPGDIGDALKWAFQIHGHLVNAESNAWDWWIGTEPHPPASGDGQALIYLDAPNGVFTATKRLYSIGNFSRFIRPGYQRIGATANPSIGVFTSAYRDPHDKSKVIVVAINKTNSYQPLNLSFDGVHPTLLSPYVTSKTQSLERSSDILLSHGSAATVLPSQSITTFVATTRPTKTKSFEDPLNDLSLVSSGTKTGDWFIDSGNPMNFDLDGGRAARTANTDSSLIYNIADMKAARVRVYYWNGAPDSNKVVLKTSKDGVTFTPVHASQSTPAPAGYWYQVDYTAAHLPRGTNYLQIEVQPNTENVSWTPQIAHVSITVPTSATVPTPPVPTPTPITNLVDPLNDFSLVYAHSNNWYFDSGNAANFNGDTSRASRTDNGDATIVYNLNGMKSATVTLFYWGKAPDSNNLVLKTSTDGVTFTTVPATQDTPTAFNDWYRVNYTITNLPANTNFLQLEVPPNTSNVTWTPQISQVVINVS